MLIYITGVPGTGKSTVCDELKSRGYRAVDADEAGLCVWVRRDTGVPLSTPPPFSDRTPRFYEDHIWRYDPPRVESLASDSVDTVCFVGGIAAGIEDIRSRFTRTFFLTLGPDELAHRILSRTNGPFANASDAQRAAQVERVLSYREECESTWRREGFESVDASEALTRVVDDVLARCDLPLQVS